MTLNLAVPKLEKTSKMLKDAIEKLREERNG